MERFVPFNIKILADFHIETFSLSLLSVDVDRANLPHGYEVIDFCSGACVCVCVCVCVECVWGQGSKSVDYVNQPRIIVFQDAILALCGLLKA